tara:strand:- start:1442 stop:2761 length:1320 start_codon:yes stop_codon:yes gene_type:complete
MIPGGDALNALQNTRGAFAEAVLRGIGAPVSPSNMSSMLAWMTGENTKAAFNPLATTRKGFDGATDFNSAGVKNFKDFEQGVQATVDTLNLSYYTDVVAALQRGTTPFELQQAVVASPWGTQHFGTGDTKDLTTPLGTQSSGQFIPGLDYEDDPQSMEEASPAIQDAWQLAKQMLDDYGLSSLFPEIESFLLKGLSAEAAVGRIRDTQEFKDRFPGLQGRVDNGYNAISPATYLTLEDNYRNLMVEAGFAPGFYDEPEDLAAFIANDVRPDEVNERIKLAQRAVMDADPLVKAELQERFGIGLDTEADLVSYFLDPERAVPLLEMQSQVGVAELGAATQRAMGTGRTLATETAQELVRRGYSERELGERLKGRGGMTQQMLGQRRGITASEVAAAEFGLDSEAVANIRRLRENRQQLGTRTGGSMIAQTGVSSFGSSNT